MARGVCVVKVGRALPVHTWMHEGDRLRPQQCFLPLVLVEYQAQYLSCLLALQPEHLGGTYPPNMSFGLSNACVFVDLSATCFSVIIGSRVYCQSKLGHVRFVVGWDLQGMLFTFPSSDPHS